MLIIEKKRKAQKLQERKSHNDSIQSYFSQSTQKISICSFSWFKYLRKGYHVIHTILQIFLLLGWLFFFIQLDICTASLIILNCKSTCFILIQPLFICDLEGQILFCYYKLHCNEYACSYKYLPHMCKISSWLNS